MSSAEHEQPSRSRSKMPNAPSYTGTAWVTPSPMSSTMPLVLPLAYRLSSACGAKCSAGAPKVSKNTSALTSRCLSGLSGASVSSTGC
eukprot:scaffold214_cov249-Pinguiococcus_pyrenoidosus.AAC.37